MHILKSTGNYTGYGSMDVCIYGCISIPSLKPKTTYPPRYIYDIDTFPVKIFNNNG